LFHTITPYIYPTSLESWNQKTINNKIFILLNLAGFFTSFSFLTCCFYFPHFEEGPLGLWGITSFGEIFIRTVFARLRFCFFYFFMFFLFFSNKLPFTFYMPVCIFVVLSFMVQRICVILSWIFVLLCAKLSRSKSDLITSRNNLDFKLK
jgi:hypothetical protein